VSEINDLRERCMANHRASRVTDVIERIRTDQALRDLVRVKVHCNVLADASGCWLWTRATVGKGYGVIALPGRQRALAHRAAYAAFVGPIGSGLIVRHRCDTPRCCNPQHLEAGTHRDNARDAIERGRQSRGDRHSASMRGKARAGARHYRATVSDSEVAYLRCLRSAGFSIKTIAAHTGIKQRTASALAAGENRANAQRPPWALPGDAEAIRRLRLLREGKLRPLASECTFIEKAGAAAQARAEVSA
jgi:hypothetical protein